MIATAPTLAIARLSLDDGMRLEGRSPRDRARVLDQLSKQARPVPYDELGACVPGLRGRLALREAGHILGSASVEIVTERSRVVVSGDLGRFGAPLLPDPHTAWTQVRPVDLVVMETTYGDRDHAGPPDDVARQLLAIVSRAIAQRGHILVPAFAIGRTQTLLYHLNGLIESGRIPGLPVVVDTPLGLRVTETYAAARALYDHEAKRLLARGDAPLDFPNLYAVRRARDSERLAEAAGPVLVLAGSGMCTGGRIVGHLQRLLPRATTTVVFAGYQARGTLGREIQEASRAGRDGVEIEGASVPLRATVETLSGLSAHADRGELRRWLGSVGAVRSVALHHGELEVQRAFARELEPG